MKCFLCENIDTIEILRKNDVYIWTDASDDDSIGNKYKCVIFQCVNCGHVYQPIDDLLRSMLEQVYLSENAQGPSPAGVGKWGIVRANNYFINVIDTKEHKTAMEIGCGDGYLLKRLKEFGYEKLIGIEPSVNIDKDVDGITFLNEFVDEDLILDEKVDFIFSIAVFEHLEKISETLSFCRNNLSENGELFFVVPNSQIQLENGDPALFIHQHIHYFTESSIRYILSKNGFQITSIILEEDGIFVRARLGAHSFREPAKVIFYNQYQRKLNEVLSNIERLLLNNNVIVHGACNALNNISCWIDGDFHLVDNDEKKQGKMYFHKIVMSPNDLDLTCYNTVLVIPNAYYNQIKTEYINRGFTGNIINTKLF